ncbi:MAG TPA: DUF6328 family protein [Solirubrobacteraceae bacterium]|jgi:hypothetical protein|nr:DUF6328 family protein [Solirubrobacteraceae bacterium]
MDARRDQRPDESRQAQLDRNLIELLNELRVTGTGIQVLLAFLLIVPFNTGYKHTDDFEHVVYFVALLSIAAATVLLIAPSVHHRLLFRQHERAFIIDLANSLAVAGMGFLAIGLIAIMVLLSAVVIGGLAAAIVGVLVSLIVGGLWFGIPSARRTRGG